MHAKEDDPLGTRLKMRSFWSEGTLVCLDRRRAQVREGEASYADVGVDLEMSEGPIKVAVHRLRQRYGELVRAEIAHTVATPEEADEELHYLFSVLRD